MLGKLTIVGLGLMGGAIGMAVRKAGIALKITGVANKPETAEKAMRLGAVDEVTLDLKAGVQDADMVILAMQVSYIPEVGKAVVMACRSGALITDIGSSKQALVASLEKTIQELKSAVHFVGSHPLTGSEKTGIEAAREIRLEDAYCLITPTSTTDHEAYRRVDEFWRQLGMRTLRLSPQEHDAVLARSSHLPHLLAYALISIQTDRSLQLSGPGLKDMTRLASSDVRLWMSILSQNSMEMAKVTRDLGRQLMEFGDELERIGQPGTPGAEAARERLFRFLADARQKHQDRYREDKMRTGPGSDDLRIRDTQVLQPSF